MVDVRYYVANKYGRTRLTGDITSTWQAVKKMREGKFHRPTDRLYKTTTEEIDLEAY